MSANPSLSIGVTLGTVDVGALVPITASNVSQSVLNIGSLVTTASVDTAGILTQANLQATSLGTAEVEATTLVGLAGTISGEISASATLTNTISTEAAGLVTLLVVGNTITTGMSTDIATLLANAGSLASQFSTLETNIATATSDLGTLLTNIEGNVSYNTLILTDGTAALGSLSSALTDVSNATTITVDANVIIQADTSTVTGISLLNGALLAALDFVSSDSLLPP